jgi:vanillate O-demethylase ferredoxin subunit
LHLSGEHGGSHLDLRELLGRQGGDTVAYVCGPEGMVHAVQAAARELGWAPQRVRSEFFGAGHGQDDVGFEVRLRSSGRSVTVGRNTSAGLELLFDCRRGECGLCQLAVVEADGPLEHRDRYLTAEERGEGRSMCICVSRIRGRHLVLDA